MTMSAFTFTGASKSPARGRALSETAVHQHGHRNHDVRCASEMSAQ
jgi:hypothetical protein